MTDTLALPHLFDNVVAQFASDAAAEVPPTTPVPNVFGWRKPAEQSNTSQRVVWVPGDDESGDLGDVGSAKFPGRNARSLATIGELCTVYLEAVDLTAPDDELAQYNAARFLFDAWYRAVYLAARGTFAIARARWMNDRATRRRGATIRVLCRIDAMVPDAPYQTAPIDVHAEIGISELDTTEQLETPEP